MMGRLDGKVAAVTGAARGMGRAHAVTLAREGADVLICDVGRQLSSVEYKLAVPEDLAETEALVHAEGRRALAMEVDVRFEDQLSAWVDAGLEEFGRLDV